MNFLREFRLFKFTLGLVTTLFIGCLIVFGFDLNASVGGKNFEDLISNESTSDFFFKINEEYMFSVYTDEGEVFGFRVSHYKPNYVPFCFFCGRHQPGGGPGIDSPSQKGDILYATEPTEYSYDGIPEGVYPYLNLSASKFGYADDIKEMLGADAKSKKHRLTPADVARNYDVLSVASSDDEDCQIGFAAIIASYILLTPWFIINLVVYRKRKKKEMI